MMLISFPPMDVPVIMERGLSFDTVINNQVSYSASQGLKCYCSLLEQHYE